MRNTFPLELSMKYSRFCKEESGKVTSDAAWIFVYLHHPFSFVSYIHSKSLATEVVPVNATYNLLSNSVAAQFAFLDTLHAGIWFISCPFTVGRILSEM